MCLHIVVPRKDVTAPICFNAAAMQHLLEGGAYSRVMFNFVTGIHTYVTTYLVPSRQFPADATTDRKEFAFNCSFIYTILLGSPS